jgi:hypothetical protein
MLTDQRLRSYLAWAVHGRNPAHRPASKPRNGPPRDEAYKAWIRTLTCLGCGCGSRNEAAHVGHDGGMSMKASDYSCVPLCSNCHTQGPGRTTGPASGRLSGRMGSRLQRKCGG